MIDGRIEGASDGPGIEYQGDCFPDPRWFPTRKDGVGPGRVPAFLSSPFVVISDGVPSAVAVATIAAAANVVSGTPMTLVTVAPGGANAGTASMARVPLVPFQQGASNAVIVSGIDLGFTTGTIVAGSATVTVPDSTLFTLGQWVCVGGAGNVGKTASLFAQVIAAPTATTITLSTASLASLSNAPISSTNLPSGAYSQPNSLPTGVDPYLTAGLARIFNPIEGLCRNLSVTGVTSGTGGAFIVRGFDVYGVPLAETITAAAGAGIVFGKKAWKYVLSITPQFTDAHNYSFGWADTFGLNLRSDKWEFASLFYNGQFQTTSAGWIAAVTTAATGTTGDVRGTVAVATGTNSGNTTAIPNGAAATNGAIRLTWAVTIPLAADVLTTPLTPAPLFGVPQFTQ